MRVSHLEEAFVNLVAGRAVVLPTDTVYGVGVALAVDPVRLLFRIKGRPREKAIPVLAAGAASLGSVAAFSPLARTLAAKFWPGPLTLVLPKAAGFDLDLGGSESSGVAVRVPAHGLARELLVRTGPLAVTSANKAGEPPALSVSEARASLGSAVSAFLDGGPAGGVPSTVAALDGGIRILRPGALPEESLRAALRF